MTSAPPRVRMKDVWRIPNESLEAAQDDAIRVAVAEMERAGLDVLTDGEIRRESYFNQFANALDGIDLNSPGEAISRAGRPTPVPRVVGPVRRNRPVLVRDVAYLRAITDRQIKVTVPGPFTMTRLVQDEYYNDPDALVAAYADVVNDELKDLKLAGADIVQLDEPYLQSHAEEAGDRGIEAINRALDGIEGPTAVHLCFGYAYVVKDKPSGYDFLPELETCVVDQISIEAAEPHLDPSILGSLTSKKVIYGVLDLNDHRVETPEEVAGRIRGALDYINPERPIVAPDCGMKYLPRDVAFAKLKSMVDGRDMVLAGIGASSANH